jgi:hypothetical protein
MADLEFPEQPFRLVRWCAGDLGAQFADTVVQAAGRHDEVSMLGTPDRFDTVNRVTGSIGRIEYSPPLAVQGFAVSRRKIIAQPWMRLVQ